MSKVKVNGKPTRPYTLWEMAALPPGRSTRDFVPRSGVRPLDDVEKKHKIEIEAFVEQHCPRLFEEMKIQNVSEEVKEALDKALNALRGMGSVDMCIFGVGECLKTAGYNKVKYVEMKQGQGGRLEFWLESESVIGTKYWVNERGQHKLPECADLNIIGAW